MHKPYITSSSEAISQITSSIASILSSLVEEEQTALQYSSSMGISTPSQTPISSHETLISKDIGTYIKKVSSGYHALLELNRQSAQSATLKSEETQTLQEALDLFQKKLSSLQNTVTYTRAVLDFFSGKSWKEVLKLPHQTISTFYRAAKRLYEGGDFTTAAQIFSFLAWIDSKNGDLWTCLGHSLYHLCQYTQALHAYGIASHCNPDDAWPHIFSGSCHEALRDFDSYKTTLSHAIDIETSKGSNGDIALIQMLKDRVQMNAFSDSRFS